MITARATGRSDTVARCRSGDHALWAARWLRAFLVPGVDLGCYVAYYFDHDYYNVWFDRVINVIQVGIFGGVAPTLLETD